MQKRADIWALFYYIAHREDRHTVKNNSKENLIKAYGKINDPASTEFDQLLAKVTAHLDENGTDYQLEILRLALTLKIQENRTHNIPMCRKLAEPIIEILESTKPWSMFDISILCYALGYTEHEKAIQLAEEAIQILDENFQKEKLHKPYKRVIYANVTYALSCAYCYDISHENIHKVEDFRYLFFQYHHKAMQHFTGETFEVQRIALTVRAQLINGDAEAVESSLVKLHEMKETQWLNYMYDEAISFLSYLKGPVSDGMTNRLITHQFKRCRQELGLSISDFAAVLAPNIDEETVIDYETGKKSIPAYHIFHICRTLGLSHNFFYGNDKDEPYQPSRPVPGDPDVYSIFKSINNESDEYRYHLCKIIKDTIKLKNATQKKFYDPHDPQLLFEK